MARVRYVITSICFSLAMTGAVPARAKAPAKLPVVATFSILADFARNVGSDRIDVAALVGPDGDTHVYQPKPADADVIESMKIVEQEQRTQTNQDDRANRAVLAPGFQRVGGRSFSEIPGLSGFTVKTP